MRKLYVILLSAILLPYACQLRNAPERPRNLKGKRPNILFVIADDQSYPHASAYGYQAFSTPGFDRLAAEGLLFRNAFVASPGCSPSRAALLTGLNCWQLKEAGTHASSFPLEFEVFPDLLEKAGYFTGFTGKGWGPGNFRISGRERNPAGRLFSGRTMESPGGISDTDYAGNFADFLAQRPEGTPFFFWMGTHEPHRSYRKGIGKEHGMSPSRVEVPAFLPDVEEVRNDMLDYGFEIQWFDQHLQRAVSLLEEAGELENTLIVVTADNGMPFPRAKANLYEYGIHVPLVMRWGEVIRKGRSTDKLVSLIDLFPTFVDLAGAEYPAYAVEGKSLLNLMWQHQGGPADSGRTAIFASRERHSSARWNNLGYPQRCIRTQRFLYIRNFKPERWPSGAPFKYDAGGKLVEAFDDIDEATSNFVIRSRERAGYDSYFRLATAKRPAEELYDIQKDPSCLKNLAADPQHRNTLIELRGRLGAYLMQTEDPRVTGQGDIFESYPRLAGEIRTFPAPEWAPERKGRKDSLSGEMP